MYHHRKAKQGKSAVCEKLLRCLNLFCILHLMEPQIPIEMSLILWSYSSIVLLLTLAKDKEFLNGDYFNALILEPWVKEIIKQVNIDNQGALLMCLYVMLVIPKELFSNKYKTEYDKMNIFLASKTKNTQSSYKDDINKIDYIRHIRNSVAHARVSFVPGETVTFYDRSKKGETFSTDLDLKDVGVFLNLLREVHVKYVWDRRSWIH